MDAKVTHIKITMTRTFFALLLFLLLCPLSNAADKDIAAQKIAPEKQQVASVEERRLLLALQQERQDLIKEQESTKKRKKELKRLEAEVDKKLDQLEATRLQLKELLAEKDARELKRIRDLSKMYEKMSPEKAARIFSTLEQKLAIAILADMKTKAAAKLLNNMDRDKAAKLTTAFSSLK
jgi:flagellar motility protein MotE (MotC chaperone)